MITAKVTLTNRSKGKIGRGIERVILRAADLSKYSAEAGIPGVEVVKMVGAGARPAQYMFFQDRGFVHSSGVLVEPSPWFTSVVKSDGDKWGATVRSYAGRVITGKVKAPAVMVKVASDMRNAFIQSVIRFDLVDSGAALNQISFRVVGYSPGWQR